MNPDQETLRLAAASGLLVLSAFCAHLLLLSERHREVRLPLALFFVVTALELLAVPVAYILGDDGAGIVTLALELAEVPLTMAKPFLLWLYVLRLTRDPTQDAPSPRWILHALPIGIAAALYIYILLLPPELLSGLKPNAEDLGRLQRIALFGLYGATVLFYGLVPVYAMLILRRLRRYRSRLKDLFASTENRELAWAWWLTSAVVVFWSFNIIAIAVSLLAPDWPGATLFDSLLAAIVVNYVLLWSIAVWGTRQNPGILPPPDRLPSAPHPSQPVRKYGKSGLSDGRLDRIARKIEALMRDQHLYLEPDLSLWDLADRVGVTTHYASQALNETIGDSFFDYVNRWRIRAAAEQLKSSDASILTIAYDVGFNSRSSFYTAFKRELGVTPSQYRAHQGDA
ncbi:MAG: helix-turn-helix transcriptional regulator [Pseudomonadota bacterium]